MADGTSPGLRVPPKLSPPPPAPPPGGANSGTAGSSTTPTQKTILIGAIGIAVGGGVLILCLGLILLWLLRQHKHEKKVRHQKARRASYLRTADAEAFHANWDAVAQDGGRFPFESPDADNADLQLHGVHELPSSSRPTTTAAATKSHTELLASQGMGRRPEVPSTTTDAIRAAVLAAMTDRPSHASSGEVSGGLSTSPGARDSLNVRKTVGMPDVAAGRFPGGDSDSIHRAALTRWQDTMGSSGRGATVKRGATDIGPVGIAGPAAAAAAEERSTGTTPRRWRDLFRLNLGPFSWRGSGGGSVAPVVPSEGGAAMPTAGRSSQLDTQMSTGGTVSSGAEPEDAASPGSLFQEDLRRADSWAVPRFSSSELQADDPLATGAGGPVSPSPFRSAAAHALGGDGQLAGASTRWKPSRFAQQSRTESGVLSGEGAGMASPTGSASQKGHPGHSRSGPWAGSRAGADSAVRSGATHSGFLESTEVDELGLGPFAEDGMSLDALGSASGIAPTAVTRASPNGPYHRTYGGVGAASRNARSPGLRSIMRSPASGRGRDGQPAAQPQLRGPEPRGAGFRSPLSRKGSPERLSHSGRASRAGGSSGGHGVIAEGEEAGSDKDSHRQSYSLLLSRRTSRVGVQEDGEGRRISAVQPVLPTDGEAGGVSDLHENELRPRVGSGSVTAAASAWKRLGAVTQTGLYMASGDGEGPRRRATLAGHLVKGSSASASSLSATGGPGGGRRRTAAVLPAHSAVIAQSFTGGAALERSLPGSPRRASLVIPDAAFAAAMEGAVPEGDYPLL